MNVKRNVAFLLVLAMFASLTACSLGSTASTPTPAESKAAEPTQSQAVGGNDGPVETEDTIVLRYASSDTTANWNEVDGLSNAESDKFIAKKKLDTMACTILSIQLSTSLKPTTIMSVPCLSLENSSRKEHPSPILIGRQFSSSTR